MTKIATYVFLDLETTSLPCEDNNLTRIMELSMVAVKRSHLLLTRPGASPRVQNKVTLCFNPRRTVHPSSSQVTGLDNDLLEFEPPFNINTYNILNTFLTSLTSPVCLIAQNGFGFDYPILKNHIEQVKVSFPEDLLCADSYHAFYNIDQKANKAFDATNSLVPSLASNNPSTIINAETEHLQDIDTVTVEGVNITDLNTDFEEPFDFKLSNETTPKKQKHCYQAETPTKVRKEKLKASRRLPWGNGPKPKISYKLKDVYERLLNRPAKDAHRAESDCLLTLECVVAVAKDFVEWVDSNYLRFEDIKPMTVGERIGW